MKNQREMLDTNKVGNDGEEMLREYFLQSYFPLHLRNNDDRYDDWFAVINKLEYKCQPIALEYGGYSVEIGDINASYYKGIDSIKQWKGKRFYPTGLYTTEAKYYVFTDMKNAYAMSVDRLNKMTLAVKDRIRFGGNNNGSLQWQIKINELEKYGKRLF